MLTKSSIMEVVSAMPDENIAVEDLVYRLLLMEKIQAAEADIAAKRVYTTAQVRETIRQWQKTRGSNNT